jgi:mono/diheme cytochrome c family protein
MCGWAKVLAATLVVATAAGARAAEDGHPPFGRLALPEEIRAWDIDVRPDGQGLPEGSGSAAKGEAIYIEQCAACHGEFGEGIDRWPVLMGGFDSLTAERPEKTVGSYWPHASTLFDYIHRAMPFGMAQSLSADQTYAVALYVLYLSDLVAFDATYDQDSFASIEMPNADGFIRPDPRPDVPPKEPCMEGCDVSTEIEGRATILDVTPEQEGLGVD